jgi:hypothetical protein
VPVRELVSKVPVEPPPPHKAAGRETRIRALINSAIGATAFLITCIGLRAILPFPEIDGGLSQKFRFFAAHKDEFDTLFIGSSRIYFQISPSIFDRVTRESGLPTHSFNFGIGGMYLPETAYLLEQILNLKPRNLRWVFIEYDELQTRWSPANQTSRRALYWADWKRVSLLLRKLSDAGTGPLWRPDPTKLRDIVLRRNDEKNTRSLLTFYAAQFQRNSTNVARAADILAFLSRRDRDRWDANYLGAASDGYVTRPNRMSPSQAAAPILLVTPSTTQINLATESTGAPGVVMAFNNPRAYPSLYRSSVRRDGQHLTKSGAEEFTSILATNFVEIARTGDIK